MPDVSLYNDAVRFVILVVAENSLVVRESSRVEDKETRRTTKCMGKDGDYVIVLDCGWRTRSPRETRTVTLMS